MQVIPEEICMLKTIKSKAKILILIYQEDSCGKRVLLEMKSRNITLTRKPEDERRFVITEA